MEWAGMQSNGVWAGGLAWAGLGWLLATELEYVGCKINCVVSKSQQGGKELISMPKRGRDRENNPKSERDR